MRVGLPQDIVEECIRGMSGVDLEDATTWFTLNRPNVNLGEVIGKLRTLAAILLI